MNDYVNEVKSSVEDGILDKIESAHKELAALREEVKCLEDRILPILKDDEQPSPDCGENCKEPYDYSSDVYRQMRNLNSQLMETRDWVNGIRYRVNL